jgi:hypothetical protein
MNTISRFLLFPLCLILATLLPACGQQLSEVCDDGIDNDSDAYIDCDDQDCWVEAHCTLPDDDDTSGDDDDSAADDDDTSGDDDSASADDDDDDSTPCTDADGDNWCAEDDCDDSDPQSNPVGVELCDGNDNDCNGLVDDGAADAPTWYLDADNDGYGAAHLAVESCAAPAGYVDNDQDCNDLAPESYPGAAEVCDDSDNNCDNSIDEGVQSIWYSDSDGDGFGDAASSQQACLQPPGTSGNADDCNDALAAVSPSATEVCDGIDNNCDQQSDEAGAVGSTPWYVDGDGDGFGTGSASFTCSAAAGEVDNDDDCDDGLASSYPGAPELCDSQDNNCDGNADEGTPTDASNWYADLDGDGAGGMLVTQLACSQPSGYVALVDADDCDDLDATSFPGGTEVCDGADNNCVGGVDEGVTLTFFLDSDGDGYGDQGSPQPGCFQPLGYSSNDSDCDDGAPSAHPGGVEVCDGIDNNCNGSVDDNALDANTWHPDLDNDGFGTPAGATVACTQPSNTVANGNDCDDSLSTGPANFPGNTELCDGQDNDCSGAADVLGLGSESDEDGDGQSECEGDCNDDPGTGSLIFLGATESCDGVDSDCNGSLVDNFDDYDGDEDPDCNDLDDDNDGDPDSSDCDDNDETLFSGAAESCDAIDNDCDGSLNDPGEDECAVNASCIADGNSYSCTCNSGYTGDGLSSCSCPGGFTDCNGACVDLNTDANNCGTCGDVCGTGSTCNSGSCITAPTCLTSGSATAMGCSPSCSKPNFCHIGSTTFATCVTECDKLPGGRLPIEDGGGGLTGSDCHGSAINAGAYVRSAIWANTQAHTNVQNQLSDENYLVDHGDCNWDTHGGNGGSSTQQCLCIHD